MGGGALTICTDLPAAELRRLARRGGGRGGPARLDGERKATLKQVVLDGPDVEATGLSTWTLSELCREVEQRWGVSYHPSHMGKLMHQLDLSWQKARPSHPKADAAAREAFAKVGCRPPSTTRGRRTPTSA